MIKESCNLIEQEYILVSHKKVYAINDKLEFNESFILNYFQWGHTTPRSINFIPGRSRGMSGLTKPAVVVLHATFPLVTVSMQKT